MGSCGPQLVDIAYGELMLGNRGGPSSAISAEEVAKSDPEYLTVAPCGFDLPRTLEEIPVIERYPWWDSLRSVREGKVVFADGSRFFNRSGMTVVRAAEILAEIPHGVISGETTEGSHWRWRRDACAGAAS